ncbi:MAG: hypothetical protein ACOCWY_05895 [Thermodesulfobacteriota bacterium]
MQNPLSEKEVTCKCGHSFITQKEKSWCEKCCRSVFYHRKDRRFDVFQKYYTLTMILVILGFIIFTFVGFFGKPLFS